MALAAICGTLGASPAGAAESAPGGDVQVRPYVSGFCAQVALNETDPAIFGQLLAAWQARASNSSADERLQDASLTGQEFQFAEADAPRAFVDRRRSGCSLVYKGASAPPLVTEELKTLKLPVGERNAPVAWRRITTRRAGPPGPIRYFLPVGEDPTLGLCTSIFEDLRLRDNAPATLVKVATCRIGGDETFDNG